MLSTYGRFSFIARKVEEEEEQEGGREGGGGVSSKCFLFRSPEAASNATVISFSYNPAMYLLYRLPAKKSPRLSGIGSELVWLRCAPNTRVFTTNATPAFAAVTHLSAATVDTV